MFTFKLVVLQHLEIIKTNKNNNINIFKLFSNNSIGKELPEVITLQAYPVGYMRYRL